MTTNKILMALLVALSLVLGLGAVAHLAGFWWACLAGAGVTGYAAYVVSTTIGDE